MEATLTALEETIPRIDADSPWKNILDVYFKDFMEYCLPNIAAHINWAKNYESLDKELTQIVREAKLGKRLVDKLIKIWLSNGQETWILFHLEVQGKKEADFPKRMFIYHYRLIDRHQVPIISIALLTDGNLYWRPNQYRQSMFGCSMELNFLVIKILDFAARRKELEKSCKPFALVILAQLSILESRKNPETKLLTKLSLTRRLYQCGLGKEDIFYLYAFIDWLIALPKPLMLEYEQEIQSFKEQQMARRFITSAERVGRIKGHQEGFQIGLEQGLEQGLERGLERGLEQGLERGIQGMKEIIIRLLHRRFGIVPLSAITEIQQADMNTILAWEEKIATADKIEDIFP